LDIEVRTLAQVKIVKLRGKLVLGEPADKLAATFTDLLAAGDSRFILDLEDGDSDLQAGAYPEYF
jgi:hypothetical protein